MLSIASARHLVAGRAAPTEVWLGRNAGVPPIDYVAICMMPDWPGNANYLYNMTLVVNATAPALSYDFVRAA